MSNNVLLQPLHDILSKAEELILLGEAEEWEALEQKTLRYQEKVGILNDVIYLKSLQTENLEGEARDIIAKIQIVNDMLDAQTTEAREKIASELRRMIQSNKAIDAYGR